MTLLGTTLLYFAVVGHEQPGNSPQPGHEGLFPARNPASHVCHRRSGRFCGGVLGTRWVAGVLRRVNDRPRPDRDSDDSRAHRVHRRRVVRAECEFRCAIGTLASRCRWCCSSGCSPPDRLSAQRSPDRWRVLYDLNPIVGIIESFRRVIVQGSPPDFTPWGCLRPSQ